MSHVARILDTGCPKLRGLARHPGTSAFAFGATAAAGALGLAAWPHDLERALLFAAFTLATVLGAAADSERGVADPAPRPLAFILAFTALLVLDGGAMVFVASAAVLALDLTEPPRTQPYRRALARIGISLLATAAAGLAHGLLGGTSARPLQWPQAIPIAAALLAYGVVWIGAAALPLSLTGGPSIAESWATRVRRSVPPYVIATAAAVVLAELIDQRLWEIVIVAAAPMYCAHRAYVRYAGRVDGERRRRDLLESLAHGVAIVDRRGRVTLWNDALAGLTGCPRDRALGRPLDDPLLPFAATALPQAAHDALHAGTFVPMPNVAVASPDGERSLQLEIFPDVDGVGIHVHDVTRDAQHERDRQQAADRLALAAEGANDGLWEWDLRTQQLYVSPRWRAMVGVPDGADLTRPEDWFNRIHPDDRVRFNESVEGHLSGAADRLHCEIRLRDDAGAYRRFLCSGVAERGVSRWQTRMAGSLTDLSGSSIAHDLIRSAEFRDPLTGLSNRAVFVKGLGERLHDLQHAGGRRFAVLYLDLDRFKVVNDSLGHLVGDELLTSVSRRLESCLRPGDGLARLGGDEFAILLNDLGDATQANAIAFRIQETLGAPFSIAGREVVTSASIGIAFSRTEYTNPEEIMRDADTAMYHAKSHGKARHELFDADMHARALDRLGFEGDLRNAVRSQSFELHYQPIVSLASGMCTGFESLVRWRRFDQMVSPMQFIPVAEELGLIEPLGAWVLQEACRAFAAWQRRFPAYGLECITVNVSTRQLMQQGFLDMVEQAVRGAGLQPPDLRLEITETALMDAPHLAAQVLRELRDFGVKIYLDDFGTGYSSLSHLHKLPVDALKIDRSFVRSLTLDDRPAIVESILALARTLNTGVVAEGVETEAQARELLRLGCRHAQGYYYSPPLPVRAVDDLLITGRPLGERLAAPPGVVTSIETARARSLHIA
jgi:diguanylate cyclase (GGDEF)-like protein